MKHVLLLSTFPRLIKETDPEVQKEAHFKLYQELKKMGTCVYGRYQDVELTITSQGTSGKILGHDLDSFDIFIPRTVNSFKTKTFNGYILEILVAFFMSRGKRVLNGEHVQIFSGSLNKLFQMDYLGAHSFPIPKTYFAGDYHNYSRLPLPLLCKPLDGSEGRGIELMPVVQDLPTDDVPRVFQEILPNAEDVRILVLGGRVLGAMKRKASPGKVVSNFSAGGSVESFSITKEMESLALSATKLFRLEFCGVDLMFDADGNPKILEINRFPSFTGFEKATSSNVAKAIVAYLKTSA